MKLKKIGLILAAFCFVALYFSAIHDAQSKPALSSAPTETVHSFTFNDNATNFTADYSCEIMEIVVDGHHVTRADSPDYTHVTAIYVGAWNPHVSVTVTPTACAPGG